MTEKKKKSRLKSKKSKPSLKKASKAKPKVLKKKSSRKSTKKSTKKAAPTPKKRITRKASLQRAGKTIKKLALSEEDVEELTSAEIDEELAAYESALPAKRQPKPPSPAINELADRIAHCMFEKKAERVTVFDLKGLTSVTDYFVVATATSDLHVRAVADHIQSTLEEHGMRAHHVEGYSGLTWVLLDYIDVVVHVFQPAARDFYDLERLWGDARITELADPAGTSRLNLKNNVR